MSGLINSHEVLVRNAYLLQGRLALLGVSDSAILTRSPRHGLAMTEHAGVYAELLRHPQWQACFGYDTSQCQPGSFETLVVFLPKARAEFEMRLAMARFLGRENARILVIGEKKEGIAGAARQLTAAVPDASKVDSARHCQVWLGHNHSGLSQFAISDYLQWSEADCSGVRVPVAGLPGVFSNGELDAGTEMLLASFTEQPLQATRILDFACGAGVIGSWWQAWQQQAGLEPATVDGIDVQAQAVVCARETYARNQARGEIIAADGLAPVTGQWQAVVTNPPFHSGVKTDTSMTGQFLRDLAGHLLPGGELRMVANSFLPYETLITQYVGPVEQLARNSRFAVYRAFRRKT